MEVLGIDIGGTGIKGAVVELATGQLASERFRVDTPQPATPQAIIGSIQQIIDYFHWQGKVGIGYPGVIRSGIIKTAANVHHSWIGINAAELLRLVTKLPSHWINDADAAATAEIQYGTLAQNKDLVLFLTIGTGIGTAIFSKGILLPNTELGHLIIKGKEAEHYCSDRTRKQEELSWSRWGKRLNRYLEYIDSLFWPNLIIIGGGASKKIEKFRDKITINTPVLAASQLNEAGIIGAAYYANQSADPTISNKQ